MMNARHETGAGVQHCETMGEVRQHIDALDRILVPLLAQRGAYVAQAARIKPCAEMVRDEDRIEYIVSHVRGLAQTQGMAPELIETIYRGMMEAFIAFEHTEFRRLRGQAAQGAAA